MRRSPTDRNRARARATRSSRRSSPRAWRLRRSPSAFEDRGEGKEQLMISRRQALMSTLFGAGYVGLRALATGIPAAVLLDPKRAAADPPAPACGDPTKAQYVIFHTSGS